MFKMWERIKLALFVREIRRNGIYTPILVIDGVVIDGRTRIKAARRLGINIPTVIVSGEIKMVSPTAFKGTEKRFEYSDRS